MSFEELLAPFLTWQFILSAILINAIMLYALRMVRVARPALLARHWFKILLTGANPLLGLLFAFVPNFLYGQNFIERAFVGMCAGFLSHFIYSIFVKRLLQRQGGVPQVPASEADTKVEKPDQEKSK